jgi:hypothetical protein
MTQQTIDDYRLNWLTKQVFRVKISGARQSEFFDWIEENVTERSWTHAYNVETDEYTFMFELAAHADAFREKFLGESRTVDVG